MTILREILNYKAAEIEKNRAIKPVKELEKGTYFDRETISLTDKILDPSRSSIIAEFKRVSPSKGVINGCASVIKVTSGYSFYGASGLSVLTYEKYFGGSAADLMNARITNNIPILRKDFITNEYQVIESKSIGADAVLLIAAALDEKKILKLSELAHSLRLQVLLEVHEEDELRYINKYIDIIGVNNRDLKTFVVDRGLSVRLAGKIPEGQVRISESGISSVEVIKELTEYGYNGFLIGEAFMKKDDPVAAFRDFTEQIKKR